MTCRAQFQLRCRLLSGVALVALGLATGCETTLGDPIDMRTGGSTGPGGTGTSTGTGTTTGGNTGGSTVGGTTTGAGGSGAGTTGTTTGTGTGGAGGTGTGGAGGAGGTGPGACIGAPDVAAPKRFIRLTFNQIVNSIGSLLGPTLATAVVADNSIPDPTERWFPPLSNPREGTAITDATWSKGDAIATQVGKYVFDNFATVTGCATATDACAQQFIATFAERAYRRPLVAAETMSLTQVYTEVKAAGGTINEGVQFSVSAIMEAPQFLYRTEFGTDWRAAGQLTPYEMASQLSYFLTDSPPDAPLLDAAKQNKLATAADIDTQVTRLIAAPAGKTNLQQAIFSYFGASGVLTALPPGLTEGVKASMYQEATLFINNTLWGPKVTDLVMSRRTWINTELAFIYNVPAPPGATLDNFVALDLPDTRSGIITNPGFLVARSRPDHPSIIARGLLVNATVLCGVNPAFDPALQARIDELKGTQNGWTERQKTEYRITNQPCMGCHKGIDPYGLSLGNYDLLARYQTADEQGRPIDSSTTLPDTAGGAMVKNATDMAAQISSNGAFAACMMKNVLVFGLAEPSGLSTDSCATRTAINAFKASPDQSFTALVRAVAASLPISTRSAGKAM